ncbi:CHAP domain-containing protein [Lacibacter sp. H407]|uniref:CHAP domain-containing protein n=1 Tax=Lacibacter sp. H407 TaxID=3133423 RepID=UPI0030BB34BA
MKYPNRIIKEGEANTAIVKAIQKKLMELHIGDLQGTGVYAAKTKNAIKLFQATHMDQFGNPLEVDGQVGSLTWAALFGTDTIVVTDTAPNQLLTEAVNVAISQLGVMEDPPGSNKGPIVNQYLASVGLPPGLFWCAAFVYWCFDKAAVKNGRANPLVKTGHVMTHWNKTKGKKILTAEAVDKPSLIKPGHIFMMNTGGSSGHTGIIEKVEGGFVHTIEGNSNNAGSRNGIGVFRLQRKIAKINRGFIEYK